VQNLEAFVVGLGDQSSDLHGVETALGNYFLDDVPATVSNRSAIRPLARRINTNQQRAVRLNLFL
jgi:hypothetical protein